MGKIPLMLMEPKYGSGLKFALMTNREIANAFRELGQLMELHKDNPFKIRSYSNAYLKLRKMEEPLAGMSEAEIGQLDGIGKAMTTKIGEMLSSGQMATLEKWREKTPVGVRQMLQIGGFGPKKIRAIWQGLGVETIGELSYAINENRLVELKGFGAKTQEELRGKLDFFQRSQGQFYYRDLVSPAGELLEFLSNAWGGDIRSELVGEMRRACPTPSSIDILTTASQADFDKLDSGEESMFRFIETDGQAIIKASFDDIPCTFHLCTADNWGSKQFRHSGSESFVQTFAGRFPTLDFRNLPDEQAIFDRANIPFLPPELREQEWGLDLAIAGTLPELIESKDIKGVVHAHSTYSDGIHSLKQMAEAARHKGYEYMLITDHSQAAFYANGLKPDRVLEQWQEIDELNEEMAPFKILKGIESDILNDGSLDYDDDMLAGFDCVIASVHSNLRMDKEKATQRLLTAIRNPHTHILGHPTGRLLLSRAGYPIDHEAVIKACAEEGVAIELNANPARLDLDWTWIPFARECGVLISINPDAHAMGGIDDILYGVLAARKGGLTADGCLNARGLKDFMKSLRS
ncbi:MAG: PHP domain-containing protein [Bacteroidota bacterium]